MIFYPPPKKKVKNVALLLPTHFPSPISIHGLGSKVYLCLHVRDKKRESQRERVRERRSIITLQRKERTKEREKKKNPSLNLLQNDCTGCKETDLFIFSEFFSRMWHKLESEEDEEEKEGICSDEIKVKRVPRLPPFRLAVSDVVRRQCRRIERWRERVVQLREGGVLKGTRGCGTQFQFLPFCLNRLFLCNALGLQ